MKTKTAKLDLVENPPFIEQLVGSNKGKVYDLTMDIMSIGRAQENDIIFKSEAVSRCHVFLKRTPKGWLVQDNQSKNGVKVNGGRTGEQLLKNGDIVQVGDFVFRFVDPSQPSIGGDSTKARLKRPQLEPDLEIEGLAKPSKKKGGKKHRLAPVKAAAAGVSVSASGGHFQVVVISLLVFVALSLVVFRLRDRIKSAYYYGWNKLAALKAALPDGAPAASQPDAAAPADGVPAAQPAVPAAKADAKAEAQHKTSAPSLEEVDKEGEKQKSPETLKAAAETQALESKFGPVPPADPAKAAAKAGDATKALEGPAKVDDLSKKDLIIHGKKQGLVKKDLGVYLQEGRDYLKEGDFESAALAFRFALVIDPNNRTAVEGIRAAEYRKRDLPPDAGGEAGIAEPDKKQTVKLLLKAAAASLAKRAYQDAINIAEKVRHIEIPRETAYLNEAKQIIDRARQKQKEDFDPFIKRAKEKLNAGDFAGSRALCEEMLRTDPAYVEAKECLNQANEGMARGK